ncbi:DUF6884 domain-containing protein [Paenibacillus sp. Soil724D2]|uniref:DUF6884 domain-containing protein n=1 Tax=Paenibacillus sp. (strain Soil724D2) TaxID=1736392 RepID=UPI0007C776E5|nr:DUF6884 domain-containing protein [Paenibacillus sp. Soil724D2]
MNNQRRLCIIPCGSAKIWDKETNQGPTQAQFVYTGVFAVACQNYAKAFFEDWMILSAKHGFLFPEDVIPESYNVSFIKLSEETISLESLKVQAIHKGFYDYQEIVVLGGKHYVNRISAILDQDQSLTLPLKDCTGIGYMLQKLTQAIQGKEESAVASEHLVEDGDKQPKIKEKQAITKNSGKYTPLCTYLNTQEGSIIELMVDQLEELLGFALPTSAKQYRAWWANDVTHSQAKAWIFAGWEVDKVNLPVITFKRSVD